MKYFILFYLSLLVISCSEKIRVYTDIDSSRDVRSFTSYQWEQVKDLEAGNNPIYYNELNDKRIKTEVTAQLKNRGYELIEGEAQLIVHYHIVITNETAYRDMTNHYYGARWMQTDREAYKLREGTLIIDFMDAKTNELIWRGYAISIIDEFRPDLAETKFREAITKIFQKFPHSNK